MKYQGYIDRQLRQVAEQRKMENRPLPPDLDYLSLRGLRTEARQKLDKIRPLNLGQASRISGVSPADIAALMIHLERPQGGGGGGPPAPQNPRKRRRYEGKDCAGPVRRGGLRRGGPALTGAV